jgi:lipopolysaccharide/colanic/teichoic acid biosynthesis glycosyltransferase
MILKKFDKLPKEMQNDTVKEYYDILRKKNVSLAFKRMFDVFVSLIMLVLLSPVFLILAIAIKLDSKGSVFYRQVRVTQYGKQFRIFKFRTMRADADKSGSLVTVKGDMRITRVGRVIRNCRLDEIPQLLNVLGGSMTFVGTRPEVTKYVDKYTPEMLATLLLPAGITSEASIYYKDEAKLLDGADDVDEVYVNTILPQKMKYNLRALRAFSFFGDIGLMFKTVFAVLGKDYSDKEIK